MYLIEGLLAVAIYYCIGHGWMSFIGNTPRRALRLLREQLQKHRGPNARPTVLGQISTVLVWAVLAPLFWPLDVINSARQGQLPKP
ncbi:hypothetical protein [Streptomyces sp. Da 82-17]|uniref:hypothetical protein n=1 Tax=Streptomyces sp. Da 82-17 TaxID=3377116 RepID=UPI0038D4191D